MSCPIYEEKLKDGIWIHQCRDCNWAETNSYERVEYDCRTMRKAVPAGLGDWVKATLSTLGITPEKYGEIKEKFGYPPDCKCNGRQVWISKVAKAYGVENVTRKIAAILGR